MRIPMLLFLVLLLRSTEGGGCLLAVTQESHQSIPRENRRRDFHIPRTYSVAESSPAWRLEFNPDFLKYDGLRSWYPKKMEAHAVHFSQSFPQIQDADTVFYPFAGTDGAIAFSLFPNARQVIAIDVHPATKNARRGINAISVSRNPGPALGGFVNLRDIEKMEAVGPSALGLLYQVFPTTRIRQITILVRDEIDRVGLPREERTHLICEFDTGEGTPRRRLVQLHLDIHPGTALTSSWWLRELHRVGVQGVVNKGSLLHYYDETRQAVKNAVVSLLKESGGTLMEDQTERWFGDGFSLSGFTEFADVPEARSQILDAYGFGYQHHARVTSFGR